ncbi:hypothetical protein K438DRAFT_1777991 [Mycena galopus ATCC 62051]|nr:hypothetical protein K438DRAFT_1777991 [Mycena galopus ATCC 62051]
MLSKKDTPGSDSAYNFFTMVPHSFQKQYLFHPTHPNTMNLQQEVLREAGHAMVEELFHHQAGAPPHSHDPGRIRRDTSAARAMIGTARPPPTDDPRGHHASDLRRRGDTTTKGTTRARRGLSARTGAKVGDIYLR